MKKQAPVHVDQDYLYATFLSLSLLLLYPGLAYLFEEDLNLFKIDLLPFLLQPIIYFLIMIGVYGSYFALKIVELISIEYFSFNSIFSYLFLFIGGAVINILYYGTLFKLATKIIKGNIFGKIAVVTISLLLAFMWATR